MPSALASVLEKKHGPYAPCQKSPTGQHCYHFIDYGVMICCYCGKRKGW